MRQIFFAAMLLISITPSYAASLIPQDLIGIWATEDSLFRGEVLLKGQAIYLDTDGIGGMISGDGSDILGVRIVVTSFNPSTNTLNYDLTEYGKVLANGTLSYDPTFKVIFSVKDLTVHYQRRFDGFSAKMRKTLGLEAKTKK